MISTSVLNEWNPLLRDNYFCDREGFTLQNWTCTPLWSNWNTLCNLAYICICINLHFVKFDLLCWLHKHWITLIVMIGTPLLAILNTIFIAYYNCKISITLKVPYIIIKLHLIIICATLHPSKLTPYLKS